jgi:HTH-type transcriptional regulator / antitoxin HipB
MSETNRPSNEIDDYIATFSPEERQEYSAAETALDLASLLYHIRHTRGLTQRGAASRTGLKQQAISRLEQAASNMQLGTLQHYLGALGYHIEISVIDDRTGNIAGKTSFSRT